MILVRLLMILILISFVNLIGGVEEARELTLRAFEQGKPVITANKALICEHGDELFRQPKKLEFVTHLKQVWQEEFQ